MNIKRYLEPIKSRLLWFIDFIQSDLRTLNDEKMLLTKYYLNFYIHTPPVEGIENFLFQVPKEKIREYGHNFAKDLDLNRIKSIQFRLRKFFNDVLLKSREETIGLGGSLDLPRIKSRLTTHPIFDIISTPVIGKSDRWKEEIIIHHFVHLIKGLPRDSLKKCEECGRYFVNFTLRKKYFAVSTAHGKHTPKREGIILKNIQGNIRSI